MKKGFTRTIAQCKNCKIVIETKSRHDWVSCKCFENRKGNPGIFIDGGPQREGSGTYIHQGGCFDNIKWLTVKEAESIKGE